MHRRNQRGDRGNLEAGPRGNASGNTAIAAQELMRNSTLNDIQQELAHNLRSEIGVFDFSRFQKIFFSASLIFSNWYYKVHRKSTQENPCFMRVSRLVHFFAECDAKHCGKGNYFAISPVDKKS